MYRGVTNSIPVSTVTEALVRQAAAAAIIAAKNHKEAGDEVGRGERGQAISWSNGPVDPGVLRRPVRPTREGINFNMLYSGVRTNLKNTLHPYVGPYT